MSNSVKENDFLSMEKYPMVKNMKAVGVCSVCGKPVMATKNDKAPRHGFKRYRKKELAHLEWIWDLFLKRMINLVQEVAKRLSGKE